MKTSKRFRNPKWILVIPMAVFAIGAASQDGDIPLICCVGLVAIVIFLGLDTNRLCTDPDLFDWRTAVDLIEDLYRHGKNHGDHRTPPGVLRQYAETMRMIEQIEDSPENLNEIVSVEWSGYSAAQKKKRKYLMDGDDDANDWLKLLYAKRDRLFPPLLAVLGELYAFCGKNVEKSLPPSANDRGEGRKNAKPGSKKLKQNPDPDEFRPELLSCDNCGNDIWMRPDKIKYLFDVSGKGRRHRRYVFCCRDCQSEWLVSQREQQGDEWPVWDTLSDRQEWYNGKSHRYCAREIIYRRIDRKLVRDDDGNQTL